MNIKEYLVPDSEDGIGEEELKHILSDFSCAKNVDMETFLLKNAIEFTKKNQSITYLVFSSESMDLVGYFPLTMKPVTIQADGMSNSVKRKLSRLSHYDERDAGYHIAAYLIAQLGRNFNPKVTHPITGKRLMTFQEICRANNGKRGRNGAASIGSVDELFIRKDTRKAVKRGPREYGSFLLPFMTGDGGKGYGVCEKGCRRN